MVLWKKEKRVLKDGIKESVCTQEHDSLAACHLVGGLATLTWSERGDETSPGEGMVWALGGCVPETRCGRAWRAGLSDSLSGSSQFPQSQI